METGIVAIKNTERAKSRLSEAFGQGSGRRLAMALALDTLDLISAVERLEWWVVSDDPELSDRAAERGFTVVTDDGSGYRPAAEKGIDAVRSAGATSALILPADLPLATPADIEMVADVMETSEVVLVPSYGDGGTNALGLVPPDVIAPHFGPGSLQAHLAAADRSRLRCTVIDVPGLALDLDLPEDLQRLLESDGAPSGRAYELCSELLAE